MNIRDNFFDESGNASKTPKVKCYFPKFKEYRLETLFDNDFIVGAGIPIENSPILVDLERPDLLFSFYGLREEIMNASVSVGKINDDTSAEEIIKLNKKFMKAKTLLMIKWCEKYGLPSTNNDIQNLVETHHIENQGWIRDHFMFRFGEDYIYTGAISMEEFDTKIDKIYESLRAWESLYHPEIKKLNIPVDIAKSYIKQNLKDASVNIHIDFDDNVPILILFCNSLIDAALVQLGFLIASPNYSVKFCKLCNNPFLVTGNQKYCELCNNGQEHSASIKAYREKRSRDPIKSSYDKASIRMAQRERRGQITPEELKKWREQTKLKISSITKLSKDKKDQLTKELLEELGGR